MTDAAPLALVAWLLPAAAFVLLARAPSRSSRRAAGRLRRPCWSPPGRCGRRGAPGARRRPASSAACCGSGCRSRAGRWRMVGVLADPDSTLDAAARGGRVVPRPALLARLSRRRAARPSLGRYYAYQSLFAFSMMGLVLAPGFVQLFVCWELVGLCSYLLDRLLVPAPGGGARGREGLLDHQGGRRRPPGRHRAAVAAGGHPRLPRAARAGGRRRAAAPAGSS